MEHVVRLAEGFHMHLLFEIKIVKAQEQGQRRNILRAHHLETNLSFGLATQAVQGVVGGLL
jgi:hypothetical protein